jgi:hypothetical protein
MKRAISSTALLAVLITLLLSVGLTQAQDGGGDDSCPVFVDEALALVADSCAGLGIDEACYGHSHVDAVFWTEGDAVFETVADRASLRDLRTVRTSPLDLEAETWGLALLNLRADVPESLPGQAVLFLLMGDATLENAVLPEDAAVPVEPVDGVVLTGANLRSHPSTSASLAGSLAADDSVTITGVDASGEWYELLLDSGETVWVWAELIDPAGDTADLPVVDPDVPRYGPMQAVYFSAGLGSVACQETPNALVMQSPGGVEVTLRINDLDLTIGSTVVAVPTTMEIDGVAQQVMVISLLEGSLRTEIGGEIVELHRDPSDEPILAFAVTLNADGRVDLDSVLVEPNAEAVTPAVQAACNHVATIGDVDAVTLESCTAAVTFPPPVLPPTPEPIPDASAADALNGIGTDDPCTVAAINTVNLRGGPGTGYDRQGQLASGATANPDGYATGTDGLLWWRLNTGAWVRGDLVETAGTCGSLAAVEAPPPPVSNSPAPGAAFHWFLVNMCIGVYNTSGDGIIRTGDQVTFAVGCCGMATTIEEQQQQEAEVGSPWITLDGVPLSIYISGIFWAQEGFYTNDGRYDWVATPGGHTVSAGWGNSGDTCSFTVIDR